MPDPVGSGHRLVPHTADLILEVWGPDRATCLEEGVRALVGAFADVSGAGVTETVPVSIERDHAEEQLAAVLEEVIYLVDTAGLVPVRVELADEVAGRVVGSFGVTPLSCVEVVGSPAKAVSRSGLTLRARAGIWRGRATIDV